MCCSGRARGTAALAVLAGLLLLAAAAHAQGLPDENPGLGIEVAQGLVNDSAELQRIGFSTHRLRDKDRLGSLALLYETFHNGTPFHLLQPGAGNGNPDITSESLYLELKRFISLGGPFYTFWGLRGGYTQVHGKVQLATGQHSFHAEQVAPLWYLGLPLALEHPGFLLVSLVDGASAGLAVDIQQDRIWLEYQLGTELVPPYRDDALVIDTSYIVTQAVTLNITF
ncbi:MAG TPA: hypothetical protein VL359_10425 [bacterium]|nr:hypothetical protein [bacterium]